MISVHVVAPPRQQSRNWAAGTGPLLSSAYRAGDTHVKTIGRSVQLSEGQVHVRRATHKAFIFSNNVKRRHQFRSARDGGGGDGRSCCCRFYSAPSASSVRSSGSFARRPREAGKVGIRKYQAGRIDRFGERRVLEPPPS